MTDDQKRIIQLEKDVDRYKKAAAVAIQDKKWDLNAMKLLRIQLFEFVDAYSRLESKVSDLELKLKKRGYHAIH